MPEQARARGSRRYRPGCSSFVLLLSERERVPMLTTGEGAWTRPVPPAVNWHQVVECRRGPLRSEEGFVFLWTPGVFAFPRIELRFSQRSTLLKFCHPVPPAGAAAPEGREVPFGFRRGYVL